MAAQTWAQIGGATLSLAGISLAIWAWLRDYSAGLDSGSRREKAGSRCSVSSRCAALPPAVAEERSDDWPWDEDMPMSYVEEAFSLNTLGSASLRDGSSDDDMLS